MDTNCIICKCCKNTRSQYSDTYHQIQFRRKTREGKEERGKKREEKEWCAVLSAASFAFDDSSNSRRTRCRRVPTAFDYVETSSISNSKHRNERNFRLRLCRDIRSLWSVLDTVSCDFRFSRVVQPRKWRSQCRWTIEGAPLDRNSWIEIRENDGDSMRKKGRGAESTWHDSGMFLFYIYIYKIYIYERRKKEREPFSGHPSFGRYSSINI